MLFRSDEKNICSKVLPSTVLSSACSHSSSSHAASVLDVSPDPSRVEHEAHQREGENHCIYIEKNIEKYRNDGDRANGIRNSNEENAEGSCSVANTGNITGNSNNLNDCVADYHDSLTRSAIAIEAAEEAMRRRKVNKNNFLLFRFDFYEIETFGRGEIGRAHV